MGVCGRSPNTPCVDDLNPSYLVKLITLQVGSYLPVVG
jgi:hypothetical protein